MKQGFAPISLNAYIEKHLKSNVGAKFADIKLLLTTALDAYKNGAICNCGNPIWVIGSAFTEYACFTCITGEHFPDDDYELDEAL